MAIPERPRLGFRRVAVICDYELDYLGGAQTALLEQMSALTAAGVEVTLIAPGGRQPEAPLEDPLDWFRVNARLTLPVVRLPLVRNSRALRRRLVGEFSVRGIQVVHLHSEFGIAAAALDAAACLGLPVVNTVHTFFWQTKAPVQRVLAHTVPHLHRWLTGIPSPMRRLAELPGDSALRNMTLAVARRADRVVSPSRHQADRLRTAGLSEVDVVPNALAGIPDASPLVSVTPPLRLLWIGRCVEEKRILPFVHSVVDAMHRLGDARLEVRIVGDGDELAAARRRADRRPGITFRGRLPHDQILDLLQWAHLSVLTSYGFDNQPMTVVESIMALRGVIYADPALTEGLQGPGIAASGTDEGVLTDMIVSLAQDPDRVVAASRAAVAARQEFSPETFVAKIQHVYARAAAGQGKLNHQRTSRGPRGSRRPPGRGSRSE